MLKMKYSYALILLLLFVDCQNRVNCFEDLNWCLNIDYTWDFHKVDSLNKKSSLEQMVCLGVYQKSKYCRMVISQQNVGNYSPQTISSIIRESDSTLLSTMFKSDPKLFYEKSIFVLGKRKVPILLIHIPNNDNCQYYMGSIYIVTNRYLLNVIFFFQSPDELREIYEILSTSDFNNEVLVIDAYKMDED